MKIRHQGLLNWLKSANDAQVSEAGTTRAYLKQIAYGNKTASPEIASQVERASDCAATRKTLRPDDWHVIWPELRCSDSQPRSPRPAEAEAGEA